MRPVDRSELLALPAYEAVRDGVRAQVIALKQPRRVAVGAHMTFLFENRDTVRYQVQEMLRAERITADEAVDHELATYNELVPREGELSATLLIEYVAPDERDRQLRALLGLDVRGVSLHVGRSVSRAVFDRRQVGSDRISSVHYVRFPLDGAARAAFRAEGLQGNVRLVVEHPAYDGSTVLLPPQVSALAADLEAA